jgi:hypothetical protein
MAPRRAAETRTSTTLVLQAMATVASNLDGSAAASHARCVARRSLFGGGGTGTVRPVKGWVWMFVLVGLAALSASPLAYGETSAKSSPPNLKVLRAAKHQNIVTLRWVQKNQWELQVENTNATSFIHDFEWAPPTGLTISRITSSLGGNCRLDQAIIKCTGDIAPISCNTCEGGTMTIDFEGTGFDPTFVHTDYGGYWITQGWMPGSVNVTALSPFGDLPLCAKGQASTKAKPCAKT